MTALVSFSEAIEDVSGGNSKLPQASFLPEGPFPVVDQGRQLVAGFSDDAGLLCKVPAPVIVFGDHTRALKYIDFPFVMGADGVKVLRVREGWDPKFVFHYLKFCDIPSAGYSRHFKFLKEVLIPQPPLEKQRRIAAILDQADALRAKRRRALADIGTLTQSIFQEMFAGRTHESHALADLSEIWDCPHSTPKWTTEGEVCLRTPNLTRGGWSWDDTRYVDGEQFATRSKGGGAQAGDIVLSREGTVGVAAIVEPGMRVCMGQRLVQVRVDRAVLDAEYALEFLLTALHPDKIARVMVGSTARHLNVRDLRALPIPVPPMAAQAVFAAKVRAVRGQRSLLIGAREADEEFFASLQSKAFRGEL